MGYRKRYRYCRWNPKTDTHIAKNFDIRNYVSGKKENKKALQETLGLEVKSDVALIGIVSRLTEQKGMYMVTEKLREIMDQNVQFVVLGTGEANAENSFKWLESEYKGRAVYYCGYNEDLAHLSMQVAICSLCLPSMNHVE